MHKFLIENINRYSNISLSSEEEATIRNAFIHKKIKKKHYLLEEGEVCKYAAFIAKGAMRQFYVDEKGKEHTVSLFIENWWATDRESYLMLTPSIYFIEAFEDTDLLLITKADFLDGISVIPAVAEMTRKMDENFAIAAQKRLMSNLSAHAEKRYSDLKKTHPEFLQRFPQYLIASYLGITTESLSRIRSKNMH